MLSLNRPAPSVAERHAGRNRYAADPMPSINDTTNSGPRISPRLWAAGLSEAKSLGNFVVLSLKEWAAELKNLAGMNNLTLSI